MNCKPGDLAIVVRSFAGNEGRICKVIELTIGQPSLWLVEFPRPVALSFGPPNTRGYAEDADLRPIRPGDLEDETPTVRELEAA